VTQEVVHALLRESPCPFAAAADLRVLATWKGPELTPASLDRLAESLEAFVRETPHMIGAVIVEDVPDLPVAGWSALLLNVLEGLRARDSGTGEPLTASAERGGWDFVYRGVAFFLAVFAPCYPSGHARWSRDPETGVVLFQSEASFRHCGVSSGMPNRKALSERVWRRFAARGQPYDLWLATEAPKSWRYVKPLDPRDAPVRWWEA
jgi:YqcI/YcgG family protein